MTHREQSSPSVLMVVATAASCVLAAATVATGVAEPDACPPYCPTPIITPAWHMHMCDSTYEEQLVDNHCMYGPGVTEFPADTERVYVIYCHKQTDTVVVEITDTGGGLQFINHPDGETYFGAGCESIAWWPPRGIPSAGSPYFTSASWPEGPFSGVGAGIEWYIGLYVSFDADGYYGNEAEAWISARDPAANSSSTVRDTIKVRVTSTSDPEGIELTLVEELPGFPLFRLVRPLRFSQFASNEVEGVIRVADHDEITVDYCPRDCKAPYTDSAVWYLLEATITPTPLPTWPGPSPSPTPTPPPDIEVDYIELRPAPADVGYVPEVSTNRERPNHLGYPSVYSGAWTRGRNRHYGMVQFNLAPVPAGAEVSSARLEMVGRESRFAKPGEWGVRILDPQIDSGWRSATYTEVDAAAVLGSLGRELSQADLAVGRTNSLGFGPQELELLRDRLATTGRISIRVDGPDTEANNLFAWHSGVDVYGREKVPPDPQLGPVLHLAYVVPPATGEATPTRQPGATATPSSPSVTPPPPAHTATATPSTTPSRAPSATPEPSAPAASPTTGSPQSPTATSVVTTPATATEVPQTATPAGTQSPGGRMLCVIAFDDADGDGHRRRDERLLPGASLRLTHLATGAYVSRTTDGANNPDYCWDGLTDGSYHLQLMALPPGYSSTGPSSHAPEVPLPFVPAIFAFGARRDDNPTPLLATPTPEHRETSPPDRPTRIFLPLLAREGSRYQ